nr:EOG090X0DK6 [Sida crystallina]
MGERKGVNKYYPPDYDPSKGGLNKSQGTHALRERARKLHLGILIIRFEMPYNIWCEGCKNHIGMGVRYNAEKTKVGMYYSTPVYQFKMKCVYCPNYIEMKTDPGNLDYVIVSGARRQERRWDPLENEQVVPDEKSTTRKLATDAMFKLEHGEQDASKLKKAVPILDRLQDHRERWKDDYVSNRILRDHMRTSKKDSKDKAAADAAVLAKASLNIELLPQSDEDTKIASLLRLNPSQTPEERQRNVRQVIESRPLFSSPGVTKNQMLAVCKTSTPTSSLHEIRPKSELASSRKKMGVSLKDDKKSTVEATPHSSEVEPGTSSSSSSTPLKLISLCDYTSSSGDDSNS